MTSVVGAVYVHSILIESVFDSDVNSEEYKNSLKGF